MNDIDRNWYAAEGNALVLLEMVKRLDTVLRGTGPLYATSEVAKEVQRLINKCTPNKTEE